MKSTGIVRRIDNLGRIVLPKELFAAFRYLERHPLHNKTRLKAVSREVKRRDKEGWKD